jgi:hypothetical protein
MTARYLIVLSLAVMLVDTGGQASPTEFMIHLADGRSGLLRVDGGSARRSLGGPDDQEVLLGSLSPGSHWLEVQCDGTCWIKRVEQKDDGNTLLMMIGGGSGTDWEQYNPNRAYALWLAAGILCAAWAGADTYLRRRCLKVVLFWVGASLVFPPTILFYVLSVWRIGRGRRRYTPRMATKV